MNWLITILIVVNLIIPNESQDETQEFIDSFVCKTLNQTIFLDQRCNDVVNCDDGSDEMDCGK